MVWFFERNKDIVVCEIRRAADDENRYEFEIAGADGPKTRRFESPSALISNYLAEQARLLREGWRPRVDFQAAD